MNPSPSYGALHKQSNVLTKSPSLVHSALGSQGLLRQGSGTVLEYQWYVVVIEINYVPLHDNPLPVNPVLQAQANSPLVTPSLVQSALTSQGSERQGFGSVAQEDDD